MTDRTANPPTRADHADASGGSTGARVGDALKRLPTAVVRLDRTGHPTDANVAAKRLLRISGDVTPGLPTLDVFADASIRASCLAVVATGLATSFSAYSPELEKWIEADVVGDGPGVLVCLRDVTEARARYLEYRRHVAEHAINQRIFETTLDLILVCDRRGNILRVSPSARTIVGYAPEELAGQSARRFIYPDDLDSTRTEMRLARRGREMRNFDCRYMHKDGRVIPLSWTGVWSEHEAQHFFVGRDMTERLAAEEQLRHAQRLESVGKLTGGIAHDFNNLLTVVISNTEMIAAGGGLDDDARELCQGVLHAAQRGAELTRQLLAFARQQPLQPKVVEINELVGNITRLMARTLGETVEVRFCPGRELWPVSIDPANLEAAIANLAVNARDAMPNGGRLVVQTENAALDRDYVRVNPDAVAGDYVAIIVTDSGSGMPPEVQHRVFEPFFTTKDQGKGTGLGLSMVFGFTKQSGGHIKVYSELGVGTTFRLYLPRIVGPAATGSTETSPASTPQAGRQERILVVEDNDGIRKVVLRQLARLGYQTRQAKDGAAALAILEADALVDLLFTDVVMPGGMSGHQLAQAAGKLRPGLRILYTSGFPGAALAGRSSADAVLSKPYRAEDLARAIRTALDR